MRTTKRKICHKKFISQKPKRRRKFNKSSNFMFDSRILANTAFNLESINEVLRMHKTARAEGKGSWKVMPKDSCEVYKKRQQKELGNNESYDDSSDMQADEVDTRKKKKTRLQTGKDMKNTTRTKDKSKKRNNSSGSVTSQTTSYSISSCSCYSDMEYD